MPAKTRKGGRKESTAKIEPPYYPIIYVRGYAMTQGEVEDTVATPYMGFNLGATQIRQNWKGKIDKFVFESPLVRLMKDHQYQDVYEAGKEISPDHLVAARSIFIYRYYEEASQALGSGDRWEIEDYARGLSDLVLHVRDRVCGGDAAARKAFRVYLVAHSMGGLICRCFLQNPRIGKAEAKKLVDKVYTYATPHDGIDLQLIGNVPGFLSLNNADNFNKKRMAKYLALPGKSPKWVNTLNDKFPPERFFSLVGTNAKDYTAAAGGARLAVGELSDGLVMIENAWVEGGPRAFVHRSHSGHFGIVNSESGYQNLVRFLFGDTRVDGILRIKDLTLPPKVEKARTEGKEVKASYHFEVMVRVRGGRWDLHRRTVETNSAIFRTYEQLFELPSDQIRHPHLFSTFLRGGARLNRKRASLGFSVELGVLVPEYEVDRRLWLDEHYEGGYLFRDKLNLEVTPPARGKSWKLQYGWDSQTPNQTDPEQVVSGRAENGDLVFEIPVVKRSQPGIEATLELRARGWH
jgi:hypothetical protein